MTRYVIKAGELCLECDLEQPQHNSTLDLKTTTKCAFDNAGFMLTGNFVYFSSLLIK